MKKRTMVSCLLFLVAGVAAASQKEPFKLISAQQLDSMMKAQGAKVAVFDANGEGTRKSWGVIPGATLLASHNKYDTAKTLPSDKSTTLVFYCANEQCMASHEAAKRAVHAGYRHVDVMSGGIMGWVKAGEPTTKIK